MDRQRIACERDDELADSLTGFRNWIGAIDTDGVVRGARPWGL